MSEGMSTRVLSLNGLTSSIGGALPLALRSKKKLYFDATFTLQELVNCTFVTGVLFAKIQQKDGGSFNGTSHRYPSCYCLLSCGFILIYLLRSVLISPY